MAGKKTWEKKTKKRKMTKARFYEVGGGTIIYDVIGGDDVIKRVEGGMGRGFPQLNFWNQKGKKFSIFLSQFCGNCQ